MTNPKPKTKANTPTPIDVERLKYLYFEMNMTQEEVANEMAVSRKVIYNTMKRNGIKARVAAKRYQNGENNHMWKGGKTISSTGYVLVKCNEHPRGKANNGYVYEHVLVMEKHLGRHLVFKGVGHPETEIIHHINQDKQDNRIENLQLTNFSEHRGIHNKINKWGVTHGKYIKN